MAIRKVEHVNLPYAGRRTSPDNSRLSALYSRGGEVLADIALRKGENSARMYGQLAGLFTNFQETGRQQKATAAAMAMREAEREQDRKEREAERKAREAERAAVLAEKSALAAERKGAMVADEVGSGPMNEAQLEDVLQGPSAGRARYVFGPGTAEGPELMPGAVERRQIATDVATQAERMRAEGRAKRDDVRADRALELADADRDAMRAITQQNANRSASSDNEPLETIIGPDGKPIRVRRSDAIGKSPASGTEKPSSGVQKRVLNFFNRAQQADVDTEAMELKIQALDLGGQSWLKYAPNFAQTTLGQQYTQAQRAFTEARLRKDSGAAIPPHEYEQDRETYFVQPGDDKETQAQKRRGRGAVLASLAFESGQALGEFMGSAEEAAALVESYKARSARPDDFKGGTLKPGETVTVGGFKVREKP